MDWNDVVPHLTGIAHLATATPDGVPHVSVVAPILDGDRLWIFTRLSSAKARRIGSNGRVALVFQGNGEAYLDGTAELVHDLGDKQRLWARPDLPFDPAGFFGEPAHPDHVLVRITPTRAVVMTHTATGPGRAVWQPA